MSEKCGHVCVFNYMFMGVAKKDAGFQILMGFNIVREEDILFYK